MSDDEEVSLPVPPVFERIGWGEFENVQGAGERGARVSQTPKDGCLDLPALSFSLSRFHSLSLSFSFAGCVLPVIAHLPAREAARTRAREGDCSGTHLVFPRVRFSLLVRRRE
jgi:hypothetical protein